MWYVKTVVIRLTYLGLRYPIPNIRAYPTVPVMRRIIRTQYLITPSTDDQFIPEEYELNLAGLPSFLTYNTTTQLVEGTLSDGALGKRGANLVSALTSGTLLNDHEKVTGSRSVIV
jgi:hypothetical protein